jgi:hypothetical protein
LVSFICKNPLENENRLNYTRGDYKKYTHIVSNGFFVCDETIKAEIENVK